MCESLYAFGILVRLKILKFYISYLKHCTLLNFKKDENIFKLVKTETNTMYISYETLQSSGLKKSLPLLIKK